MGFYLDGRDTTWLRKAKQLQQCANGVLQARLIAALDANLEKWKINPRVVDQLLNLYYIFRHDEFDEVHDLVTVNVFFFSN